MARLRRAFLLAACVSALDQGDIEASERFWIRAAVDHLTDPHVRTMHAPTEVRAALSEAHPPPSDRDDASTDD